MLLCYKLPEISRTPTPDPLLRETLLTYSFCFKLSSRVAWFRCPVATGKATLIASGTYDHIWERVGYWQRPVTSLDPKFWCYIIRRFGSLGGQSRSSLAAGIAARLLLKISLCARSLSTSRTITFTKECTASNIATVHYISKFLYSPIIVLQ